MFRDRYGRILHGILAMTFIYWGWLLGHGAADPQINLLNKGCSTYNVSNAADFYANLNATFSDLRAQLSNNSNPHFATAQQVRGSVYAMVQCRNYLSSADCMACFSAAVTQIRNCSAANGARVIYDGCFLRYSLPPSFFCPTLFYSLRWGIYIYNSSPTLLYN